MTHRVLHFTLAPVQGFIADARRVRDFWAGSFLLSWLSGQAMAAVVGAGGEIDFPRIDGDELFEAVRTGGTSGTPHIGSLPNRFRARVPDGFDVEGICGKAIRVKWGELADKVWDTFIAGDVAALGEGGADGTTKRWNGQVGRFWEIIWVAGAEELGEDDKMLDGPWLDQRKNWRMHLQEDEPGDLCRLMGRFQELSGWSRIHAKDKQAEFWSALSERKYDHPSGKRRIRELNLRPDERLCAIALIKRLFPLVASEILGWRPGGDSINVVNWPSVSYISAVPWLKAVADSKCNDVRKAHASQAEQDVGGGFKGETETRLFGLPREAFFTLDGHLMHKDGIASWEDRRTEKRLTVDKINALQESLGRVQNALDAPASEFYAVLIMDGDEIGKKIRDPKLATTVKDGLAGFTNMVKAYFDPDGPDENPANGVLIYAGGDDVLAFMPVDKAIEAARMLRAKYDEAVAAAQGKAADFTMSGAIIFAQYKIPLRAVLDKAHHYLDKVAKDKNGRDSLAIAVMKPGGVSFDWVSCWKHTVDPVSTIEQIAKEGAKKAADYSTSFLYNIRERYAPLFDGDDPQAGRDVPVVFAELGLMKAVLAAEFKKQQGNSKKPASEVEAKIAPLMTIGQPLERSTGTPLPTGRYDFDGALVARFLAMEGRWHLGTGGGDAGD